MAKRSPRYPRLNLAKSVEMTRKLFAGAHRAKVDVDTAARVIGYAGSGGGAASSALGALRQFGLVDGLRGDVAVSELAMRILEPMHDTERTHALYEAALKPEIFERIMSQFNGVLPVSDEPIRSYLIRQEGYLAGGASELIQTLRETVASLPPKTDSDARSVPSEASLGEGVEDNATGTAEDKAATLRAPPAVGELITLPLGQNCKAELRLIGDVTSASYERLIRHLELLREIANEENDG